MKQIFFLILFLFSLTASAQKSGADKITLVIHGGAGTILKKNMTPEKEKAYTDAMNLALQTGYKILQNGGTSIDAVEAAIRVM